MKINASQLNFLLNPDGSDSKMSVNRCNQMIYYAIGGNDEGYDKKEKYSCSVDLFESKFNHYPIKVKIQSIQQNFLKKQSTFVWITEYPLKKLMSAKNPIKKVSIPSNLRYFLDQNQINEILHIWRMRYSNMNQFIGVEFE